MRTRTAIEIELLEAAAASWIGTPWCPNSAVKDAGVCCHMLCAEVLFEAGWLPRFDVPRGAPQRGRAGNSAPIVEFLEESSHFFAIGPQGLCEKDPDAVLAIVKPGDVVISAPARLPHHCSLALSGGRFLHVQFGGPVGIAPNLPEVWRKRLAHIFRPLPAPLS